MSEKNNSQNKFSALEGINKAVPIILILAAALITLFLVMGGGARGDGGRSGA